MKGIGILLVLIGHVWSVYIPITHHIITSFHMPLFFIVAGYFSKSYTTHLEALSSIKKYFTRLVVPMVLTQTAMIVWTAGMAILKGNGLQAVIIQTTALFWADVLCPSTPYGPAPLGVVWFLLALFVAKSILLFLSRLQVWAIPVSIALACGALLLQQVFPYSIWCISLGLTALPFVTIGWLCRHHLLPVWVNVVAVLCWILALLFSNMDMYSYTYGFWPLDVVGACGGTYCLYLVCHRIARYPSAFLTRALAYIGIISLAIMCVHCFEIESHLGNHLRASLGINLSTGWLYLWRYALTIALAVGLVHIPKVKKLFI